jgi:hypothetical protein
MIDYDILDTPRMLAANLERYDEEKRKVEGKGFNRRHVQVLGLNPTPQQIRQFEENLKEDFLCK